MVAPLTIGAGWEVGPGWTIGPPEPPPTLMLSLDASTYTNTTSGPQQNVSGTSDNTGFFPYGWPAYSAIQPGWTCVQTGAVVTVVDGVNHVITTVGTPFASGSTYTFTSSNSWIDSVGNLPFILQNSPTYSSSNGGYLTFVPASSQYAQCATSLSNLNTWSVEAWHYYTGTNSALGCCIVTEVFPGNTGQINYTLGSIDSNAADLQAAWFTGSYWNKTAAGYSLTPNNWYQIVATYDGSTIKLYVNNALVQQVAATGNAGSSQGGINLMRRWDNADYWGGNLAIVKIYDGAMGPAGVAASWNANKTRFGL